MLKITPHIRLNESEIDLTFIRAPGPGGQNVNKVASAVQLRFNILRSPSLPEDVRARLMRTLASRLTHEGELVLKATRYRTQERNKQEAIQRLLGILSSAAIAPKKRKKTKPTFAAKQERLAHKKQRGQIKKLRDKQLKEF